MLRSGCTSLYGDSSNTDARFLRSFIDARGKRRRMPPFGTVTPASSIGARFASAAGSAAASIIDVQQTSNLHIHFSFGFLHLRMPFAVGAGPQAAR